MPTHLSFKCCNTANWSHMRRLEGYLHLTQRRDAPSSCEIKKRLRSGGVLGWRQKKSIFSTGGVDISCLETQVQIEYLSFPRKNGITDINLRCEMTAFLVVGFLRYSVHRLQLQTVSPGCGYSASWNNTDWVASSVSTEKVNAGGLGMSVRTWETWFT